MKLSTSLNSLAVAAVLALASASASANIIGAGQQDSEKAEDATELMLVVWSESAKLNYVQDLGVSIADVKANANNASWMKSFSMDALYTGSALAGASDAKWFVAAYDTFTADSALNPGDLQLVTTISTSAAISAAQPGLSGDQMSYALASWIEFTTLTENTTSGTHKTTDNGVSLVNDNSPAWILGEFNTKDNLNGNFSYSMANAIGATSGLYHFTSADYFDGGAPATLTTYLSTVNFDGATLTISAVPEPATYAMLAAGMLAIGAVVRRRQQPR